MHDDAARQALRTMFAAAIAAADPMRVVPPHLPPPPQDRCIVIGAGKASALMARAVETHWTGDLAGLVVTRYGHAVPCERIAIVEAAHPVPDAASVEAAQRMLDLVQGLSPDDLVLALLSGGGSSLLVLPAEDLTLADKQEINRRLLASGASIREINCVRKHLSAIKGGRLAAAAHPARVLTLLISDVPGDDPAVIASGPTIADETTCAQARDVLAKYGIVEPRAVLRHLADERNETPKPHDPRLAGATARIVASGQGALEAAANAARARGIAPIILGDAIEGEAREVARVMAGIARQARRYGQPLAPPCVLLSGGETSVTVRGAGCGGRNAEFLLALGLALDGASRIWALAGDTDGVDGMGEAAGALLAPDTLARAVAKGIDAKRHLAANDAHPFFGALGDQVVTGPTLTNANDFRAILIGD